MSCAIFSFASFFQKLAKAVGGAGVAAALALAGYVANVEQSPASLAAIHNLMTLAPVGIMVLMIVAASFYRLDKDTHAEIVAALRSNATKTLARQRPAQGGASGSGTG